LKAIFNRWPVCITGSSELVGIETSRNNDGGARKTDGITGSSELVGIETPGNPPSFQIRDGITGSSELVGIETLSTDPSSPQASLYHRLFKADALPLRAGGD
jgi:hypothetical protein